MTSNFCKTSWHPYGHTPEECPDCRLCHESKIPKKLEFRPHLTTGVIARDRDMEMLVLWLNELRDYLQAKEEASKSSWHTFWSDSKKCVCCNKTLKELEKSKEASKGECKLCGGKYGDHGYINGTPCPKLDPPEHEEELLENIYKFLDMEDSRRLAKYIRDNFVSKEKIKREVKEWRFVQRGRLVNISDLFKRLGIGLEEL